ncbi:MAG: UDP-N-acetylglucosamine 1-carboxyvinyltransferase [bacterium]|nr:UDP-N-acetylglucosamine 1-carboxyvinyltransferase [bacterium]
MQKNTKKSSIKPVARFNIKGIDNKKILNGVLPVRGAKNAVLKAQAASLLFSDEICINNSPLIDDVIKMNELLEDLGVEVKRMSERSFVFKQPKTFKTNLDPKIAKSFRASIVLTGPLLAREGKVSFPHPGGCVIGKRPIDVFLDAFIKMGAKLKIEDDRYILEAKHLKGIDLFFKVPSVTATETLIMTAVLINGTTKLYNCACEPEIESLADFLNLSGAKISGAGTPFITIKGGKKLKRGVFNTPPDRIEAGSFAIIAALCGKNLKIANCDPNHMHAILCVLENAGVDVKKGSNYILINAPSKLKPVDIKTHEYPGFPTDLQAPVCVLLTQAVGSSSIFETVFEDRLNYTNDLVRMGANIMNCGPHRAIVSGPTPLHGREMESLDLRAGLAFLTAALISESSSVLHNINNIDRGYEKVEERLNKVGAEITREN